jgi:hypothetical protein
VLILQLTNNQSQHLYYHSENAKVFKQQNIIRDILEIQSQGMNEQASMTEQCLDLLGNLSASYPQRVLLMKKYSLRQSMGSKVAQEKRNRSWFSLKRGSSPQKNCNMVSV